MQDPRASMALEKAVGQTVQPLPDCFQRRPRSRYLTKKPSHETHTEHDFLRKKAHPTGENSLDPGHSVGLAETYSSARPSHSDRSKDTEQGYRAREGGGQELVWNRPGYQSRHYPLPALLFEVSRPSEVVCVIASTALDRKLVELLKVVTPTPRVREQRSRVLCELEVTLARVGLHVEAYGSSITGVMTVSSDLDCAMMRREERVPVVSGARINETAAARVECALQSVDQEGSISTMQYKKNVSAGVRTVATMIRRARQFFNILSLSHARVPIVKCVHRDTGISVDLSFAREGLLSSSFLCGEYMQRGNEMARGLTVLVKTMLANSKLGDPSEGGLGSFPIALMVLFFLQTEVLKRYPAELQHNLAVLVSGFLRYYGREFDFRRRGIDYVRRTSFEKGPSKDLYIINPIRPGANCAKAAQRYATAVVPFFDQAAHKLCSVLDKHASESHVEGVLSSMFQNVLLAHGNWSELREAARNYRGVAQHLWDSRTNMYIGGLVDQLP